LDNVTVSLYRIITQKTGNFFSSTHKAGVAIVATLNGKTTGPAGVSDAEAKTPSVSQVDVQNMPNGQVSLPLEYPIAANLPLSQGTTITGSILLEIYLAKTRGPNTFGTILDAANQYLAKLPIPANPYTTAASKFVGFADQAIQDQIGSANGASHIANLSLFFADQPVADIAACQSAGHQVTGALAIFMSTGASGKQLLPTSNLSQLYCFRYVSEFTYELQYAAKPAAGSCDTLAAQSWAEVPNDYLMALVTAEPILASTGGHQAVTGQQALAQAQRIIDLRYAKQLCRAFRVSPRMCGIR
jgi:hypothetical protein